MQALCPPNPNVLLIATLISRSWALLSVKLKEGSIFVTVLLPLPSDKFEVIAEEECLFSWGGKAPLVVHKKRRQLEGENDLLASLGKMNNWRRE